MTTPESNPPPPESLLESSPRTSQLPRRSERPSAATPRPSLLPPGSLAEEAALRGALEKGRRAKDEGAEYQASVQLARWLARNERDLDQAVALAMAALATKDDRQLRSDVATWLEYLGDAARAAEVLAPLATIEPPSNRADGTAADREDAAAARTLLRIGILSARAGEADAASEAFVRAAFVDSRDPLPCELRGSLSAWAPEVVSPEQAGEAYLEAADRRERAWSIDAQLQDLWRAFDVDPTSERMAKDLAAALTARGRSRAADEAVRAHAMALRASLPERARAVHTRRRVDALASDDIPRGMAAALDELLDGEIDGAGGDAMDELLARAGLMEPLAVRLEIRAERASAPERAKVLDTLGRLLAGQLANPERAVDAFAAAMAADPTRTEALIALRAHTAKRREPGPLVEALVRMLATEGAEVERGGERALGARLACARTLMAMAEEQLSDPSLAAWAAERVLRLDPDDAQARASLTRAESKRGAAQERLEVARAMVSRGNSLPAEARVAALRTLASALRGAPTEAAARAHVLAELAERVPGDRSVVAEAYRVLWGRGDGAGVRALAEGHLEGATEIWQRVEARRQLAAEARTRGAWREASDALRPLLEEAPGHGLVTSMVWAHAVLAGDRATRARALVAIAATTPPRMRAAILGAAATALHEVGDDAAARRVAEQGSLFEPGDSRCVIVLAEASTGAPDADVATALERALDMMGPRPSWCGSLADARERAGDRDSAVTWTQRLVALRPGDPQAMASLVRRAVTARDPARLGDAVVWALSQAQPAGSLTNHVAGALGELAALDLDRAGTVAKRALDAFGPRHDPLREAMTAVADASRDDVLGAAILERWIAIDAPTADRGTLHADLVKRRAKMGDRDGEARAIERAMRDGFDVRGFEANLDRLAEAQLGPDGEIAFLQARAALAFAKSENAVAGATLRQLGASLWVLARDRLGAVRAFVRSSELTGNAAALGADLARFGDSEFSLSILLERLAAEPSDARAGALAGEAAGVAMTLGDAGRAFSLAARALAQNPLLADALAIAERASIPCGRTLEMSPLYDAVGARALGRFGRRAAHYRAARFFELRGEAELAMKHAAEAFAAVPSEGTTFALLARAAERSSDRGAAVRTIERVAQESQSASKRAGWLLRAASILGTSDDAKRERVDLLLRASLASPEVATLALLADAAKTLLAALPEEREVLLLRFARAAQRLTRGLEGPDGARVAIALGVVVLDVLGDIASGGELFVRALALDADVEEFARLLPFAARLGTSEGAAALLWQAIALCDKPYANVGPNVWRLIGAIAEASGDRALVARAAVSAAVREPDDDALVHAADAAVRGSDDPSLAERLGRRVSAERRVEALVRHGRSLIASGAPALAIDPFERAFDLLDALPPSRASDALGGADRPTLERELAVLYESIGGVERLEERVLRAASDARLTSEERAARWGEIAAERERRGDLAGASSAFFEAAVLEPTSLERWSSLERVATEARRHDLRVHALEEIASRVSDAMRVEVLRRLARAHEEAGNPAAAERAWHEVWEADPGDEESDRALESFLVERGDYEGLSAQLGRRAEQLSAGAGLRDELRAVRLRRAAILEQRLNRPEDAAEELSMLLTESPDNETALSYLADLYDRIGSSERAAPLWRRAASLMREPSRQIELELRAASASRAAGDFAAAMSHVESITAKDPGNRGAAAIRVEIARAEKQDAELGNALEHLSTIADDVEARASLLVESAQAAIRAHDVGAAFARAQLAAKLAPRQATAQLFARSLEYKVRGSGSPDDARATIEALGRVDGQLLPDDAALHAFLLAEAFDAVQGGGAGLHRLLATERQMGPHPVLSLGLGERFVAQWKFADAVPHFKRALDGGLFGLRKPGSVAIAGADAAMRVEDRTAALAFLEIAAADPHFRATALRRLAAIVTSQGDVARGRGILLELARAASPEDRARTLAQLARLLLSSGAPDERDEAFRVFDEAIGAAPIDGVLRVQLENELASLRARPSVIPRGLERASAPPPESPRAERVDFMLLETEAATAGTPAERARARVEIARRHIDAGAVEAAEPILWEVLDEGSAEAGELLASILERDADRAADRLRVCRRLVDLSPGHLGRLEALRAAANADRNTSYARAIEHLVRSFDPGAGPLPPPPLSGQRDQPGMLAYLTRPSFESNLEPFAVAWEGAHTLFAKSPVDYGTTGVDRVAPGPASPVASLYDASLRVLGVPRLPLFYRRTADALSSGVALTHPASALVTGDGTEDTTELRHALGHALASALPIHVLLLGVPEARARTVWRALLASFGTPNAAIAADKDASILAEQFWSTMAPRAQRRLKELLSGGAKDEDFEVTLAAARQSARRVALFIAGDFGFAARRYLAERKVEPGVAEGVGLQALCAEHAPLADLFRLAASPEYADARWHPVASAPQRNVSSSGGRRRGVV